MKEVTLSRDIFIKRLSKEYKGIALTTLGNFTHSIKVVPSVRSGDESLRTFYEYIELSSSRVDKYGIATSSRVRTAKHTLIKPNKHPVKSLGAANKDLVMKYRLQENNLLLSYRGTRHINVARVGNNYEKVVVASVSNIRIVFNEGIDEDTIIQIQEYLTLGFVQEYLSKRDSNTKATTQHTRFTLSCNFLSDLPLPHFSIKLPYPFKELYKSRKEMLYLSQELLTRIQEIYQSSYDLDENALSDYINKNEDVLESIEKDRCRMEGILGLNISEIL